MSDGIVVGGGGVEEIGNRFEVGEAPVFEPPLKGSGGATTSPRSVSQWANC